MFVLSEDVTPEPPRVTLSKGGTFGRGLNHNYCGAFADEVNEAVRYKEQTCHPATSEARCESRSGRSPGLTRPSGTFLLNLLCSGTVSSASPLSINDSV